MNLPDLNHMPTWLPSVAPHALIGIAVFAAAALMLIAALTRRSSARAAGQTREKPALENRLTLLVAVIIAGVCAQGMGRFFRDELGFPLGLVIVVGGVLELTAFTCALRARRNVRDPDVGRAGVDGVAVWVVAALSGVFSALDAENTEVAVFRLVMPLLAAWLWERGMSIERRRAGQSTIHWRVTPERVLVWLRVAEPTGRTASEVDAHRRLTRVAKAAAQVRSYKAAGAARRAGWAEARLERATRSAVAHAGLAQDPARQRALIAQIGSLYNATALADLTPDAPWAEFATPPRRTLFELLGLPASPPQTGLAIGSPAGPLTGPAARSQTRETGGSRTQQSVGSETQVPDPTRNGSDPAPQTQVPDQVPDSPMQTRSQTHSTKTQTGPKKRTRSKTKPKPLDRIDEATAADKAYLAEHGRHIPAEKLAKALSIGKPAALDMVKQVRGGHIDVAK